MFFKDPQGVYRVAAFRAFPWLEHGFGTRQAGAWVDGPLATVKQVHSNRWVCTDSQPGCLAEADALLCNNPGLMVGVYTADCLPVLVLDPVRRVVAAAHAGWRGTAQGLLLEVVAAMRTCFGTRPEDLLAATGPAICGACYEVGPDVAARFQNWFPERTDLDRRTHIDLVEAARRQLARAGLRESCILSSGLCTCCGGSQFCSHRRTPGGAGRMLAAIGLRKSPGT